MKIRSFSHVGLTVSDFGKAVKWYYDMFGFRLIEEQIIDKEQVNNLSGLYGLHDVDIRLGFLQVPKGGVLEIFEILPSLPAGRTVWNKPGLTHFTLDVKNVGKWCRLLQAKGVHFFSEPQKTGNTEWVFMEDPDGNLIELIDMKANYFAVKYFAGIAGKLMSRSKFKKYYSTV